LSDPGISGSKCSRMEGAFEIRPHLVTQNLINPEKVIRPSSHH